MGIHDRDYMRSPEPSRFRAPRTWTTRLLLVNVAAFAVFNVLLQNRASGPLVLSLEALSAGQLWTLLTAAFLHVDAWHIVGNMLGLWFLGMMVEETLGGRRFLRFYLLACVLSWLPFLVSDALVGGGRTPTVGASGAVTACVVCAALYFPQRTIILWFVPMRLWLFASVWVGVNLLGLLGPHVNYGAHLGGAAIGYLQYLFALSDRLPGAPPGFRIIPKFGSGKRDKGRRPSVPPLRPDTGEDTRERVDALLDKISREGIGSLTDEERAFLTEASKRY